MKPVSFIRTSPRELGEEGDEHEYKNPLSLDAHFVAHPTSTFFVRVGGDLHVCGKLDIRRDDVLVVDRAVPPCTGTLSVFVQEGELVVARLVDGEAAEYWGSVIALARRM